MAFIVLFGFHFPVTYKVFPAHPYFKCKTFQEPSRRSDFCTFYLLKIPGFVKFLPKTPDDCSNEIIRDTDIYFTQELVKC